MSVIIIKNKAWIKYEDDSNGNRYSSFCFITLLFPSQKE